MPQTLGKYEILAHLGSGATADVYHARDTVLGREVALKVLKPALVPDSQAYARFVQEARAAAQLFHPHIATVLDIAESDGRYYIAMRYISGRSLDHILKETGALAWDETRHLAQHIGAALDYAHQGGFLHRDVKPSNIVRSAQGEYVLTDFGLTRAMMSTGLTSHTGAVLGTPAYIAPEIWQGLPAVPATDQYALACVVYEALTGQALFSGETPPAIMTAHVLKGARLPAAWPAGVPVGVTPALERALRQEPAERWGSAGEFARELGRTANLSPSLSPIGKGGALRSPEEEEGVLHFPVDEGDAVALTPSLSSPREERGTATPAAVPAREREIDRAEAAELPKLQENLPEKTPSRRGRINWKAVGLISLAWTIGGLIGNVVREPIYRNIEGILAPILSGIIAGATLGLALGWTLWRLRTISPRKSIFFMILGWATAMLTSSITWFLISRPVITSANNGIISWPAFILIESAIFGIAEGFIGGLATGLVLIKERSASQRLSAYWIAGGWTIANVAGWWITFFIGSPIYSWVQDIGGIFIYLIVISMIYGPFIGAIGGTIMFWVLGRQKHA